MNTTNIDNKIYIVTRKDPGGYDEYCGHVVVASDVLEALQFASNKTADEGAKAWTPELCNVKLVHTDIKGIVLSDFNAG